MTSLSPAARAVLDAGTTALWNSRGLNSEAQCIAAALRATADLVAPLSIDPYRTKAGCVKLSIRNRILYLADELEGRNETSL